MADLLGELSDLGDSFDGAEASMFGGELSDLGPSFDGGRVGVRAGEVSTLPITFFDGIPLRGIRAGELSSICPDLVPSDLPVEQQAAISQRGGQKLTLTGTFPVNVDLEVFIGPNGDDTDAPVYGGQGFGYRPQSADGTTLKLVTPLLGTFKGAFKITIRRADGSGIPLTITGGQVLERPWRGKVFSARKSFPPWYNVGSRGSDQEGPL